MDQLKRLRVKKGLSQARLAARAGLDPSTVNQIERGAREASPVTLRKLADALDISIAGLLESESPKAQAPLPPNALTVGVGGADDPIRAAAAISELRNLATGLASTWNQDVELYAEHGRDVQPYRAYEMSTAVSVLYQQFWSALRTLQNHALEQGANPDPGTWDSPSKQRLRETLASIHALTELYKVIDQSTAKPGVDSESFRARREEFDVGTPAILGDDPQWPEAVEKARTAAGLA